MAGFQHFSREGIGKGLGDERSRLIQGILQLIMMNFGGLRGFIEAFQKHDLSSVIESWISEEANSMISMDQVEAVLGKEKIAAIAGYSGVAEAQVRDRLPDLLPELVDRLTPEGQIPEDEVLDRALQLVLRRLNKEPD